MEESLVRLGISQRSATALVAAAQRPKGLLVICGPTGMGKTTIAEVLIRDRPLQWVGDLRHEDETRAAVVAAASQGVLGVVRSGESFRLLPCLGERNIPADAIERASLVIATVRKLPLCMVVEVIGTNGVLVTRSLCDEASAAIQAGLATDADARYFVPGYEENNPK